MSISCCSSIPWEERVKASLKQSEGKDGACPPQFSSFQAAILLQAHPQLHRFSPLPLKQLLCPRGCFLSCFSPVSFSSKPFPWIFVSWIKPPSFLQLPAQCLGNLLPNLLVTMAKKTLQNTDDQKQSAVMLLLLAYAPWQHVSATGSSKEASCKSCPARFPPLQMEALHALGAA